MELDLTRGSVLKNVVRFSLPYLLSYFLQTLYGMADLFIIGQYAGVEATTAVSVGSQVMHMLTVMIVGLAMGTTVSIAQTVGEKDHARTAAAAGSTVTLFMSLSVLLTGLLLLLRDRACLRLQRGRRRADRADRGAGGRAVHAGRGGHAGGQAVSARVYLGQLLCMRPVQLQRLFLCLRALGTVVPAQFPVHRARPHSGGLRRLVAVCADASADGACKRGRVAVFDPCVCLRLSDSDAAGAASTGGLNIQYDGMFLVLEKEDAFEGDVTELGRSLCVRVRFRGSHLQSPEQYARLLAYTKAHGLVAGFSREITLVDYGLTSDPEKFVAEITIPVRPAG